MNFRTEIPETLEQCLAEVPKRFITGSVNGQFIDSMKKLVQIIPLALNNQFQEPKITNRISLELKYQDDTKSNQDVKSSIEFTHTSRPSDFRIKSICESMTLDHLDDNSGQKTIKSNNNNNNSSGSGTNKQQVNEQTIETASKPMCKLFDEFIADFSTSIER